MTLPDTTRMELAELLPCPFCGNNSDTVHMHMNEHDDRAPTWTVQCDDCTGTIGLLDSEEEATECWNTRTPQPIACTCHPLDNPPRPCPMKFALSECRKAAAALRQPIASDAAPLRAFVEQLPCECDSYHGFTCGRCKTLSTSAGAGMKVEQNATGTLPVIL